MGTGGRFGAAVAGAGCQNRHRSNAADKHHCPGQKGRLIVRHNAKSPLFSRCGGLDSTTFRTEVEMAADARTSPRSAADSLITVCFGECLVSPERSCLDLPWHQR